MSDNLLTQSTAPSSPPSGTAIAARLVTYSGDSNEAIAPVGLVCFAGADDAKVAFDLGAALGVHHVAAGSGDATNVKAGTGVLTAVRAFNNAAYPIYVKFHNNSGTPTPGTGVVYTVGVQAGLPRDVIIPFGKYFSTGIAFTIVKGIADADATSVTASDCVVDVEYN